MLEDMVEFSGLLKEAVSAKNKDILLQKESFQKDNLENSLTNNMMLISEVKSRL